jgi:hypothetical protein
MAADRWLNLELRDSTGAPLAERPYALTLADGTCREGRLDRAGRLHEPIPAGCQRLRLDVSHRRIELDVVGLPPSDSIEGAQERLNQLHYFVGDVDRELGPFTAAALRRFQRDHALPETGALDAATADRIREEHGS